MNKKILILVLLTLMSCWKNNDTEVGKKEDEKYIEKIWDNYIYHPEWIILNLWNNFKHIGKSYWEFYIEPYINSMFTQITEKWLDYSDAGKKIIAWNEVFIRKEKWICDNFSFKLTWKEYDITLDYYDCEKKQKFDEKLFIDILENIKYIEK